MCAVAVVVVVAVAYTYGVNIHHHEGLHTHTRPLTTCFCACMHQIKLYAQALLFYKFATWMLNGNDNNNNIASIQLTHWTGLMTEFDLTWNATVEPISSLWPVTVFVCLLNVHFASASRSPAWLSLWSFTHTHTVKAGIGVASQSTLAL